MEWAKSKGLPHSRVVHLCISVPQLSASALARLHEIPQTDGIHFGVSIETTEMSDDGVRALAALRNMSSIAIRGCPVPKSTAIVLKGALPDCKVDIELVTD